MKRQINFLSAKDLLSTLGVLIALAFICPTLSFGQAPNCVPTPCVTCTVTPCLLNNSVVNKTCLDDLKKATKKPILPNMDCSNIKNKLANGINMEKMFTEIKKYPFGDPTQDELDVLCDQPGKTDLSWGSSYCPDRYCTEIKMLVESNAKFIGRAGGQFASCGDQKPGSPDFKAMQQLVCDINAAYDCNGIERPVIQGAAYEHIEDIGCIKIPRYVRESFKSKMSAAEEQYYFPYVSTEPADLEKSIIPCFTLDKITISALKDTTKGTLSDFTKSPDATKIEGQMWMYYLATQQIAMGYTSIAMGDIGNWCVNDKPDYTNLSDLCNKIRDYATSKKTTVWIGGEVPDNPLLTGPNKDVMIFDFYSMALRPKEVGEKPESDCEDESKLGTDYTGTACEGQKNAYISICRLQRKMPKKPVKSPTGCDFGKQPPITAYWDFGPGYDVKNPNHTIEGSEAGDKTWGWDDVAWWNQLSEDCKAIVLGKFYCDLKDSEIGGYVQIPGLTPFMAINPLGLPDNTPLRYEKRKTSKGIDTLVPIYWEKGLAWIYDKPELTSVMNMLWGNSNSFTDNIKHKINTIEGVYPKNFEYSDECNGVKATSDKEKECYFLKKAITYSFSVSTFPPIPKCVKSDSKYFIDGIEVASLVLEGDGKKHTLTVEITINGKKEVFTQEISTKKAQCKKVCGKYQVKPNKDSEDDNISIFPNPAAEERIIINIKEGTISEISISDISGRLISRNRYEKRESLEGLTVDISELEGGTYVIRVQTDEGNVEIEKLIIEK